ncbi:MAG: hypothetical protein HY886_07575 [Deltaproteobacteria bacterium]|nr:hypothetical protein [Deltaproteobacteria bacterium]
MIFLKAKERSSIGRIWSYTCYIFDQLKERKDLPNDFKEDLFATLSVIAWNGTKLLAFSNGKEWTPEDSYLIDEKGYDGYEKVAVKYNHLEETSKDKEKKRLRLFANKFYDYLNGMRAPNRTFIHELLLGCKIKDSIITELTDLTEKVTMGALTWDSYVEEAKLKLKIFESSIERL